MSIVNFNELESPTRVHHPTKESYVVSAEEAKELFKQGWYPRRKFAKEAAKNKPEKATQGTKKDKPIVGLEVRRKELEKMKFFALRSLHKKVTGKDERNMKTNDLIEGILKQEAE